MSILAILRACYNSKPRVETKRFKRFTSEDIEDRDYNLDIFWLKDELSDNEQIFLSPKIWQANLYPILKVHLVL